MNLFSLSGKTALVAGASRGIGLAIAQQLAGMGARTILAARSVKALQQYAKALPDATALELDITKSDSIRAAVEAAGTPDILRCPEG